MIKTVAFDLGKVLLDFDYGIAVRKLAAHARMPAEELARFLARDPLLYDFETGLLTGRQFYQRLAEITGYSGSFEEFAAGFGDIFTPIQPMIDLQTSLRQRGITTFIFSNTNELSVRFIRHAFPFFAHFDGHILSYEHGSMKPDSKLYEVVERACGRCGPEVLYIDDRPENIATGETRGWQVILHQTPAKTRAAVEAFGLLNDPAPR